MTVLDSPPQTAAHDGPAPSGIMCPECGQRFAAVHPNQMFCCQPHRKAFLNRQTARGSALTPLEMASRITRGGSRGDTVTGKRARREAEQLIQRWIDEDRTAGRQNMVDYVARCFARGFRQV